MTLVDGHHIKSRRSVMHIGKEFDRICDLYGIKKSHVARKLSVSPHAIKRWQNCASWPTDRLVKVAEVLRVSPCVFLHCVDAPAPPAQPSPMN